MGTLGPINAPDPIRTLVLIGEDPQDELDRRLWDIAKGQFPDLLHACSVYGEVGPLMRLDGNIPTRADGFKWLEETIQGHPGLELLILDPKSRFYGLERKQQRSLHPVDPVPRIPGQKARTDHSVLSPHAQG